MTIEFEKKTYLPDDILDIEIENTTCNLVIGKHPRPIGEGRSKLEIRGSELPAFVKELETEVVDLERAKSAYDRAMELEKQKLFNSGVKDAMTIKSKLLGRHFDKDNPIQYPQKRFYDSVGRWPKVLRSLTVLSSRRPETMRTAMDKQNETIELLKDILKQNQELIKTLSKKGA